MVINKNFKCLKDIEEFIDNNDIILDYDFLFKNIELLNKNKKINSAYYTPQNICCDIVSQLPSFKKDTINILEPSVGAGNFIPEIIKKYKNKKLIIDIIDIDNDILKITTKLLKKFTNSNVIINPINIDFLLYNTNKKYDIIVGNPPFGKISKTSNLKEYKLSFYNKKTNNLFSFFVEKSLLLNSDYISLIIPKSFLNSPEYNSSRELLENKAKIISIIDFGEKAFNDVKIETISICFKKQQVNNDYLIKIKSYITKTTNKLSNNIIFDHDFSMWLIYKNNFFNEIKQKMLFNIFNSFRDRSITKKQTKDNGNIRVLKSRNIANNKIIDIPNYDQYIDSIDSFSIKKFLNTRSVLVPNLAYNTRACFLPRNAITDGSIAILTLKNPKLKIDDKDLEFYSSSIFQDFYKIGRNLGTRSLNIDSNSVKLFGIIKENVKCLKKYIKK